MRVEVFIENEAGSKEKHLHDEKTLAYKETLMVSRKYPYPYGFILDTTSEDGDNVDVFVITNQPLKSGQIVTCEVIGLMEQFEKSWSEESNEEEIDHNVLVELVFEKATITDAVKNKLTDFALHVFDDILENKVRVGEFLGVNQATRFVAKRKDSLFLKLLNRFRSVPSINTMVIVYFFFTWCSIVEYGSKYANVFIVILGFACPFTLLIGILKYKNAICYGTAVMTFLLSILIEMKNLYYLFGVYANNSYSNYAIVCNMVFPLLALSLLHNRRMVSHYNWTTRRSGWALIAACALILVEYLANIIF